MSTKSRKRLRHYTQPVKRVKEPEYKTIKQIEAEEKKSFEEAMKLYPWKEIE